MAEFIGTTGNDSLTGTEVADTFINNGGIDTLLGLGGDDRFTLNSPVGFGSRIEGGTGTDTIVLGEFSVPLISASLLYPGGVPTFGHTLLTSTVGSLEALEFMSQTGSVISLTLGFGGNNSGFTFPQQIGASGLSEAATITGGAGTDVLVLVSNYISSITPEVVIDIPTFNYVDWFTPERAYQAGDRVVVVSSGNASVIINGSAHDGVQQLSGGLGDDTINGSDDMDQIGYTGGTDRLYGNGGNDALTLINLVVLTPGGEVRNFLSGEGTLFDGGAGTDFLVLGGYVEFGGTMQNIEGIYLAPAYSNVLQPGQAQAFIQEYTEAHFGDTIGQLPSDLILDGEGLLVLELDPGSTFDASGYTFTPGSNVTVAFSGDDDGNEFVIGTSNGDLFDGDAGDDTFTGGGGSDTIYVSIGHDVMTDFTPDEDKFDVSATGIASFAELSGYLAQTGADVVFSFPYAGILNTLTLKNVSLAGLSAGDFVFASSTDQRFESGTDLADLIIGQRGDDFLFGNGGNDTIVSGGGFDMISGDAGDDTIFINGFLTPGASINGGEGIDTLLMPQIGASMLVANALLPNGVPQTSNLMVSTQLQSLERLEFQSSAGTQSVVSLGIGGGLPQHTGNGGGSTGLSEIVGGNGFDHLLLLAVHLAQTTPQYVIDAPAYSYTNWDVVSRAYYASDRVSIVQLGNANGFINGNDHIGVMALFGGAGNDTITGSDGMEFITGGNGGVDHLRGEGGDDTLGLFNTTTVSRGQQGGPVATVTLTNTGAGSVFDGGNGFDFLGIGGVVDFKGSALGIEGIWLAPAYSNTLAPGVVGQAISQAYTSLTISTATLAQLPQNLLLDGTGDMVVNVLPGSAFNGSQFIFETGSSIFVVVNGSSANDLMLGTSQADYIRGGAGGDTIIAGPGNDTVDGGDGNDIVVLDGAFADFTISVQGGEVAVNGSNGNQTFVRVETFRFTDGDYVLSSELVPGFSGTLADGHIEGATVYLDVNNNGQLDEGEPTAITKADGTFVLATSQSGTIRAFGGTDTSTGLANLLTLTAPSGSSVVNPLTTVIQSLVDQGASAAEAQVKAAFGLDAGFNLTQADLIDSANFDPAALAAQKAAVSTAEVAKAVAMNGGDSTATISAIASAVGSSGGAAVSLRDSTTLNTIISAGLPGVSPDTIAQLVQQSQIKVTKIEGATDLAEIVEAQVNSAPEFEADSLALTTLGNAAIAFSPVASDADGDALTYTAGAAANGTVMTLGNGTFVYSPNAGFLGADSFQVTADDGFGGTAQQTISVTVQTLPGANRFVTFTSDGFAGSLVGRGSVFGSNGHQDISILDGPGSVGLDASFNRGGDIVRLPGDAADWHVIRAGSSAIFNDGDTFVSISVGSAGMPVVFEDGERLLQFNTQANQMEIGGQAFDTTTFVPVSAPADGSPLPTGADPDAMAVMFLNGGANVSVAGSYSVFGTAGAETVRLISGEITLDPSFNRGGDTVRLDDPATGYTATRSGSSILLQGGDLEAVIPVGSAGAQLVFADDDVRTLLFDQGVNGIMLGGQLIGTDPVQLLAA